MYLPTTGPPPHPKGKMRSSVVLAVAAVVIVGCASPEDAPQLPPSSAITVVPDLVYGRRHGMALTMNVFRPATPNGAGVIFLNSGGWVSPAIPFLDQESETPRLRTTEELAAVLPQLEEFSPHPLLDAGFTVFDVVHRSSPRFNLPEVVQDVRLAVRVVKDDAADFGVDPERIGVWGGSAGGHLALMLGSAPELANESQNPMDSLSGDVAAVVAFFPVSDFDRWIAQDSGRLSQFPALDFEVADYPDYSPTSFATEDDPPTLIVHGDSDALVPLAQGQLMYEALESAGAPTELVIIEGADHGFLGEDIQPATEAMLNWFMEHLEVDPS